MKTAQYRKKLTMLLGISGMVIFIGRKIASKKIMTKCEESLVHAPKGFYEKYIKRSQDMLLAITALFILWPLLLILAVLIHCKLGSPVLFVQERPGLKGKTFRLYKFRTMTSETDQNDNLLPDEERLTAFGRKLRSTSLDELPELFNIIRGDMAIVGPRPLLVKYMERYNEHQARRHEVRPGITGLAQIHGRNAISWEEKFDWDVKYVDNITFRGDWKILLETIGVVLRRKGISSDTSATMEEFMGNEVTGECRIITEKTGLLS